MRQDGIAKRKTEVDMFAGTVIEIAKKHNIHVPVNERIYMTVKEMEKLKSESKEKTVTYKQLFAVKLETQHILTLYKIYGLIDEI